MSWSSPQFGFPRTALWVLGRISLLLEGCHRSSCWPTSLCISRLVGPSPAGSHLHILLAQNDVCIPNTQTKSQSEGAVWLTRWPALPHVLKTGIREINSLPSLSSCNICPFPSLGKTVPRLVSMPVIKEFIVLDQTAWVLCGDVFILLKNLISQNHYHEFIFYMWQE